FPKFQGALKQSVDLRFDLEHVTPEVSSDALHRQRFELSERVRRGELAGILEIGPNVPQAIVAGSPEKLPDDEIVRFSTNTPTAMAFRDWANRTIDVMIKRERLSALNLPQDQFGKILSHIAIVNKGLARKDPSGAITYTEAEHEIASFLIPFGL